MSCATEPSARIFWSRCDTTTAELVSFAEGLQGWDSGRLIQVLHKLRSPSFMWFGPFLWLWWALIGSKMLTFWGPPLGNYWADRNLTDVYRLVLGPQTTYKTIRLLRLLEKHSLQNLHSGQRVWESISLTAPDFEFLKQAKKKSTGLWGFLFWIIVK